MTDEEIVSTINQLITMRIIPWVAIPVVEAKNCMLTSENRKIALALLADMEEP